MTNQQQWLLEIPVPLILRFAFSITFLCFLPVLSCHVIKLVLLPEDNRFISFPLSFFIFFFPCFSISTVLKKKKKREKGFVLCLSLKFWHFLSQDKLVQTFVLWLSVPVILLEISYAIPIILGYQISSRSFSSPF